MKRADVPHSILSSSDWSSPPDDGQTAEHDRPVVPTAPPSSPAGRPVSRLFDDLAEIDGEPARPGLSSSATDLHKVGVSSASMRRRFLRSRSHQNLLRVDVRDVRTDTRDHLATATPKLFACPSPRLFPTCVGRAREGSSTDCLSLPLDLAIRSTGSMILQMCGIDVSPLTTTNNNSRKARSFNL